jgi:small subunit ribosomal protein S29e
MRPKVPKFGRALHKCKFCKSHKSLIRKYKLGICRKCFKDKAVDLGWTV